MSVQSGDHGEIITFYSYKGGSGRSMALANIACLLADGEQVASRRRVLVIDWDLEAPGLQRFFQPYLSRTEAEIDVQLGLIDLFVDLESRTRGIPPSLEAPSDPSWAGGFDFSSYVIVSALPGLDVMKAGRFDSEYTKVITSFDWAGLYSRAPWLFSWFTNELTDRYRYILVDSRTGETDASSICTSILHEKLVAVFTPNLQAIQGVLRQVERAVRFRRTAADERPH
jgi:cellulose biosynthesis protein BcsQ